MGEIIRRRKRSSKPVITTQADSVSEVVTTEESPFSTSSNVEKSKVKSQKSKVLLFTALGKDSGSIDLISLFSFLPLWERLDTYFGLILS